LKGKGHVIKFSQLAIEKRVGAWQMEMIRTTGILRCALNDKMIVKIAIFTSKYT